MKLSGQDKLVIYGAFTVLFGVTALLLQGCAEPQQQDKVYIECRGGHLYSIIPTKRYELIEKDGCTEDGKIILKRG